MESMVAAFSDAWTSKRLVYCAIENNDKDKDYVWENIRSNPTNAGLGSIKTFKLINKKQFSEDWENALKGSLLAVMICLPVPEVTEAGEGGEDEDEKTANYQVAKEKSQPIPIGFLFLTKDNPDFSSRRTMVVIQLAKPYQDKGYGREAVNWAIDWAFQWGDMHRVDIASAAFNERAIALYESVGFKREGITRDAIFMNRKWHDLINLGMLESEWEELRRYSQLERKVPARGRQG